MSRISLFIIVVVCLFSGCRPQSTAIKPEGLIPRDSMISLMATMELNEAALRIQQKNTNRDSINRLALRSYDSLYSYFRYTPEQFKTSLDYYQNNLDDFQKMLDEVILMLTKQRDSIQNQEKAGNTL